MLNKRQYRFISGFVDPFSLIIVGFFLLTVISGVAVVKNKDVSMNISKFAKMVSEESGIGKTSSTTKKTPTPTVFKMSPSSPTPNPTNQETGSGKTSLTTPITTPVNQETQVGKTSPPTSTPTPTPIDNQENQVGKISPPTPTQTPINQESGAGTTAKPTNIPTPTPTPINQQSQIGKTPKPIPSPTPFCYETLYADCINGCVPDIDGGKCKDPPKVCETTTCADSCAKGVRGYSGTCQNGICICSIQKTINGRNCSTDSECESGHCYETFSEYINRVGIGDYKTELTFESQKTCHSLSKEENKEERQDEANLALAGVARGIYSTLWNPLSLGLTMAQGLQSGSDACNFNPESTECVLFLAGAIMGTPETNAGINYFTQASSVYLNGMLANYTSNFKINTLGLGADIDTSNPFVNIEGINYNDLQPVGGGSFGTTYLNTTNGELIKIFRATTTDDINQLIFYKQYGNQSPFITYKGSLINKNGQTVGYIQDFIDNATNLDEYVKSGGKFTQAEIDQVIIDLQQFQKITNQAHGDLFRLDSFEEYGNLHPENILVQKMPDGGVRILPIDFGGYSGYANDLSLSVDNPVFMQVELNSLKSGLLKFLKQ